MKRGNPGCNGRGTSPAGSNDLTPVEIGIEDVPDLFTVRTATRENALSRQQLSALGIDESSVIRMLETSHRGWLCRDGSRVVGFAMGNGLTGEMWVVAVLPEYEGRGIGRALLGRVEAYLRSRGRSRLWLTTDVDPSLRAYGFYRRCGWRDWKIASGLRYMKKTAANRM